MAAAAIFKIGFMVYISVAMVYLCTNFFTGTKNDVTTFAVKIHFLQNPRWL